MITHIRASRNLGRGFLITSQPGDPPSAATLIYNTASGNGSEGILFDKGFFTTVGNTSRSNHGIGIGIGGAQGALFGDRAFHNAGSGLQVNDVVDADVPRQCINSTQGVEISAPFIRGIWSCNAGKAADG